MKKILFDSHAHINYEGYTDSERTGLMDLIEGSEVGFVLDVGFDLASSRQAVADAASRDWCYAAVGIHPHDAGGVGAEDIDALRRLAREPKVLAIGEIGLDYYRDLSPRGEQRDAFKRQLALGLELGLPITIHDRDSGGDTIEILKTEGAFSDERKRRFAPNPETGILDARILLHCFSGSAEQAAEYIALGATISIAGPVTYKNNKKTVGVAAAAPLSHLLIETDAPYLTPEPKRGTKNDSTNVAYVARKIAEVRGLSYEEIAAATMANAKRFLNIQ
jgi:TatD DNase family protein